MINWNVKQTYQNQEDIHAYKYNSFQTYDETMKELCPLLFWTITASHLQKRVTTTIYINWSIWTHDTAEDRNLHTKNHPYSTRQNHLKNPGESEILVGSKTEEIYIRLWLQTYTHLTPLLGGGFNTSDPKKTHECQILC